MKLRCADDKIGGYAAYRTLAVDYLDAQRQRGRMVKALAQAFGEFDAIVSPTVNTVAYPIGERFEKACPETPRRSAIDLIAPGNLAGMPAVACPNGFGDHGLPTSFQLLGMPDTEDLLCDIGSRYQEQTQHHLRRPDLITRAPVK